MHIRQILFNINHIKVQPTFLISTASLLARVGDGTNTMRIVHLES